MVAVRGVQKKCNNQTYLWWGLGVVIHHLRSFLFGRFWSLLQKMPVSSQSMMYWKGVFFEVACFPLSAGGF
jgi:hypothetical protein